MELDNYLSPEIKNSAPTETAANTDHRNHEGSQRLVGVETASSSRTYPQRLRTWWSNNICPTVIHSWDEDSAQSHNPRDYLALERTYLAHIRTANALILFGVALVQLFRLRQVDSKAGLALGAVCAAGGMIIVFAAGRRYFLQQKKLTRRKAVAGGLEAWIGGLVILGIVAAVFVLVLAEA
ncbi:MAG: hypothetical protein L6R40_001168 [Gallowayella cf. fulva]|nr:MAG: hypothetical protein L6R40_001168 [Xanthomendoza cf. fulva]